MVVGDDDAARTGYGSCGVAILVFISSARAAIETKMHCSFEQERTRRPLRELASACCENANDCETATHVSLFFFFVGSVQGLAAASPPVATAQHS